MPTGCLKKCNYWRGWKTTRHSKITQNCNGGNLLYFHPQGGNRSEPCFPKLCQSTHEQTQYLAWGICLWQDTLNASHIQRHLPFSKWHGAPEAVFWWMSPTLAVSWGTFTHPRVIITGRCVCFSYRPLRAWPIVARVSCEHHQFNTLEQSADRVLPW